jgi:hypothetical protein
MNAVARRASVVGAVLVLAVIQGCAVHFPATPADPASDTFGQQPGFYYALPKTVLEVAVPVTIVETTGGEFAKSIYECIDTCGPAGPAAPTTCMIAKIAEDPKPKYGVPEISATAVPDPKHVYFVQPDAGPFMTVEHEFTMAGGVLLETKNSGTNETAKAVAATLGAMVQIATKVGTVGLFTAASVNAGTKTHTLGPGSPPPPWPPATPLCPGIGTSADLLDPWKLARCTRSIKAAIALDASGEPAESNLLACSRIRELDKLIGWTYALEVASNSAAATRIPQWSGDIGAGGRKLQVAQGEKEVAAAVDARNKLLKAALMKPAEETHTVVLRSPAPLEPTLLRQTFNFDLSGDVAGGGGEGRDASDDVAAAGTGFSLQIDAVCGPAGDALASPGASGLPPQCIGELPRDVVPEGVAGYRYRLPVSARVSVLHDGKTMVTRQLPIAQFGPIVALPATFKGANAHLDVVLDGATGALTSAKLGQKAQDPAVILDPAKDVAGTVADVRKARADAKAKADEKALTAPTDELKRANDLAEQKIKSQRLALCAAALQANPEATTLPDICKD